MIATTKEQNFKKGIKIMTILLTQTIAEPKSFPVKKSNYIFNP